VELFIVPLPVMWFCAGVGIVSAAAHPQPVEFLEGVGPAASVAAAGGVVGLLLAGLMVRLGWIQRSFIDADDRAIDTGGSDGASAGGKKTTVAATADDGVNPRQEVLHEAAFLAPAAVLAFAGYLVVTHVPAVRQSVGVLFDPQRVGALAGHVSSAMAAVLGLLVGVAWIWGTRILGTLGFGKEAMGMGDVHILAAIGAVAGWKVATLTFFAAPMFGLVWALYLATVRGKRELPYGPWLALGALIVLLFYDAIIDFILPAI